VPSCRPRTAGAPGFSGRLAGMDDLWGADRLDLDAYLARVGVGRDVSVAELHRAHVAAVPFENLDVMLGRGVRVDLPDVAAKLVDARRGGYCYEHAVLLGAALERLGHRVERRLARIGDPAVEPRSRSHLVLLLSDDDGTWLADTGFGAGLLEPVLLVDGAIVTQGAWSFRTDRTEHGWRLSEQRAGAWVALYTVPDETTFPPDVVAANWVTSTLPASHFTQRVLVHRKDGERLRVLVGRTLTTDTPAGRTDERTISDAELGPTLADLGLDLPSTDVTALAATLATP